MKADSLPEGSARLDISMLGEVAMVLDASESAGKYQGEILQLAAQLIEKLPAGMGKRLYFLGNPAGYDCRQFARQGAAWWRDNCRRASFIKPIASGLKESRVVVIGSGEVYDLEDWEDIASRLLLVNVGDASLRGGAHTAREVERPDIAALLPLVYDPVESVEISGTGFMPHCWDNSEYKLSLEKNIALKANRPQNPAVTVSFWGSDVHASVQRSTSRATIVLSPAGVKQPESWELLNEKEGDIARDAISNGEFTCPVCGCLHPAQELRCHEGYSILGDPVYASFGGRKGFVVLRLGQSVSYRFHPVNVINLGGMRVGVAPGGGARIFEYDSREQAWVDRGNLQQYCRAGEEFILAL